MTILIVLLVNKYKIYLNIIIWLANLHRFMLQKISIANDKNNWIIFKMKLFTSYL
jgi:hypothetical protein